MKKIFFAALLSSTALVSMALVSQAYASDSGEAARLVPAVVNSGTELDPAAVGEDEDALKVKGSDEDSNRSGSADLGDELEAVVGEKKETGKSTAQEDFSSKASGSPSRVPASSPTKGAPVSAVSKAAETTPVHAQSGSPSLVKERGPSEDAGAAAAQDKSVGSAAKVEENDSPQKVKNKPKEKIKDKSKSKDKDNAVAAEVLTSSRGKEADEAAPAKVEAAPAKVEAAPAKDVEAVEAVAYLRPNLSKMMVILAIGVAFEVEDSARAEALTEAFNEAYYTNKGRPEDERVAAGQKAVAEADLKYASKAASSSVGPVINLPAMDETAAAKPISPVLDSAAPAARNKIRDFVGALLKDSEVSAAMEMESADCPVLTNLYKQLILSKDGPEPTELLERFNRALEGSELAALTRILAAKGSLLKMLQDLASAGEEAEASSDADSDEDAVAHAKGKESAAAPSDAVVAVHVSSTAVAAAKGKESAAAPSDAVVAVHVSSTAVAAAKGKESAAVPSDAVVAVHVSSTAAASPVAAMLASEKIASEVPADLKSLFETAVKQFAESKGTDYRSVQVDNLIARHRRFICIIPVLKKWVEAKAVEAKEAAAAKK